MEFKKDAPIYLQIAANIKEQIMNGKLLADEKLQSVREYSVAYEVSALTIQRAMQSLDYEQIIYSRKGVGNFVRKGVRERLQREVVEETATEFVQKLRNCGLNDSEILDMIQKVMSHKGGKEK